ncbi:MAG: permease-like cell division protein FtsX [Firmicutes bacterium]|nr:permease-like cell division protein FtsX [Bacillota bacterium]
MFRSWGYCLPEAFRSIVRNSWMSFASVGAVAVTLFILGSFMLLNVNVEYLTNQIKDQVEIIAYVDEVLSGAEVDRLRVSLIQMDRVEEVRFVSRQEALQRLKEDLGEEMVAGFEADGRNPLRDSFEIRAIIPEDIPQVATELEAMPGIARIDYGTAVVEKLFRFAGAVRWVGLFFMGGLALTALFLIANTIKLTVAARSTEIMIMKYVGATEWFVRWPFLIEGLALGSFGALLPTLALIYLYGQTVAVAQVHLNFLPLVPPQEIVWHLARILLLLGTAIGGAGSLLSMRRFLKA